MGGRSGGFSGGGHAGGGGGHSFGGGHSSFGGSRSSFGSSHSSFGGSRSSFGSSHRSYGSGSGRSGSFSGNHSSGFGNGGFSSGSGKGSSQSASRPGNFANSGRPGNFTQRSQNSGRPAGPRPMGPAGARPAGPAGPRPGYRPAPPPPPPVYRSRVRRHGLIYRPYIIPPYFLYGGGRTVINNNYYGQKTDNGGQTSGKYGGYSSAQAQADAAAAGGQEQKPITLEEKIDACEQMKKAAVKGKTIGTKRIVWGILLLVLGIVLFVIGTAYPKKISPTYITNPFQGAPFGPFGEVHTCYAAEEAYVTDDGFLGGYGETTEALKELSDDLGFSVRMYTSCGYAEGDDACQSLCDKLDPNGGSLLITYYSSNDYWYWNVGDDVLNVCSEAKADRITNDIIDSIIETENRNPGGDVTWDSIFANGIRYYMTGDKKYLTIGNGSSANDLPNGYFTPEPVVNNGSETIPRGLEEYLGIKYKPRFRVVSVLLIIIGGTVFVIGILTYIQNKKEEKKIDDEIFRLKTQEVIEEGMINPSDRSEMNDLFKKYGRTEDKYDPDSGNGSNA